MVPGNFLSLLGLEMSIWSQAAEQEPRALAKSWVDICRSPGVGSVICSLSATNSTEHHPRHR